MPTLFTLDRDGVFVATALGIAVFLLGGSLGSFFLFGLFLFLVLSAIATNSNKKAKQRMDLYEKARGRKNVVANGIVPFAIAVSYAISSWLHLGGALIITIAYVASIGAITGDKFASEFGVMDGDPFMLLTMKRTEKGASGAVTTLGTGMSLVGSMVIAASVFLLYNSVALFLLLAVSGFAGSLVDSALGYFEEQGIGSKYTTNVACAASGALISVLLFLFLT